MHKHPIRLMGVGVLLIIASGCAGEEAPEVETEGATVTFREPADGATVGPDVEVALEVTGVEIAPSSDTTPGTGHHHIFIDEAVTPAGQAIPQGQPNIRHFGQAQTEFVLTGLTPGQHRLIAVVGDWEHIPLANAATDTITITVEGPAMSDSTAADTTPAATPMPGG